MTTEKGQTVSVGSTGGLGILDRTNRRNAHGLKASCDCYRTINDHIYTAWLSCPGTDRIAAYRKAGIRCRRFGDELFVHSNDLARASDVDAIFD